MSNAIRCPIHRIRLPRVGKVAVACCIAAADAALRAGIPASMVWPLPARCDSCGCPLPAGSPFLAVPNRASLCGRCYARAAGVSPEAVGLLLDAVPTVPDRASPFWIHGEGEELQATNYWASEAAHQGWPALIFPAGQSVAWLLAPDEIAKALRVVLPATPVLAVLWIVPAGATLTYTDHQGKPILILFFPPGILKGTPTEDFRVLLSVAPPEDPADTFGVRTLRADLLLILTPRDDAP